MTESPATQSDLIVGIDLGTTNSLIAYSDDAGPRVLGGDDDIVPSAVRYDEDGTVVVGNVALAEAPLHPESTVTSVKRLLGRSIDDASGDLKYLGYRVVAGENQTARVALPDGRTVTPEEVSAEVLRELKTRAELALGAPVTKAVVTVPAYFDDAQRQATRNAGRLSGLEVVRIVNEPTAAALAYGIGAGSDQGARTVAVYDLGGGTFDVSILRLTPGEEGGPDFFQVLSTAGDTRLGGDDIDHSIMALFAAEIGVELGRDDDDPLSGLPIETRRALHQFARAVKHRLSEQDQAAIEVSMGTDGVYRRTLTRAELEELIAPIVERSIAACERAMRDAKRAMGSGSIDAVIMVGGSTRIPLVRERVGAFFGIEPYTALDPDRIVALGASVQASIIAGTNSSGLLLDVIPLSLGIETAGGAVAKLVVRNTTVPTRATERFSTSVDGQTNIKLNILQGEREMAEDCRSLGVFELRGIPPMPAGIPKLVVEFLVDANGVLRVSAIEERSGKRASVQVIPNHGLTESEVKQIEADSLTHAREDMSRHRIADLITNSELDLKWIGERLAKHRDALDPAYREELDAMIDELRGMVDAAKASWSSVEPNAFYAAKTKLDEASVRLQEVSIAASLRED